jgi:hypothetical protein
MKGLNTQFLSFSPVFSTIGFEQHHQPYNVFPPLSSYTYKVDSPIATPETDFENLILYLAYGSSFSSFPPTNTQTVDCNS